MWLHGGCCSDGRTTAVGKIKYGCCGDESRRGRRGPQVGVSEGEGCKRSLPRGNKCISRADQKSKGPSMSCFPSGSSNDEEADRGS